MTRPTCFALIVCWSLVGCLFEEDEEPSPRTREQFCREWAASACNEEVVSRCQASDAEDCRASQEDFCRSIVPDTFADDRAGACLEAVAAAYADGDLRGSELVTVRMLGEPCDQLSRGPRSEGQSCMERADCDAASGFDCVFKADRMSGTCEVPEVVSPGEDCDADQQVCTDDFFCNGENCISARDEGEECMHHEECGEAGYCDTDGTCAERFGTSEPCEDDVQCADGVCYDFGDERICTDRIVLSRSEPICDDLR